MDQNFLEWLAANRAFGVNYLKKNFPRFTHEDAEDIYNDLCEGYLKSGARRFVLMVPGMIAHRLTRLAQDELAYRNTVRRGRGYRTVSISTDYFESCGVPDLGSADRLKKVEQTEYILWLVDQAMPRLNERERILARAIKRWVLSGCAGSLCDEFTRDERMAFYFSRVEKGPYDEDRFRDKVSKRLSDVIKVMREIAAKDSGECRSSAA